MPVKKNLIIYNFVKFLAIKKVRQQFFPLIFFVGSVIHDWRSGTEKNPDTGKTSLIRYTAFYYEFQDRV
jgi:hypothetical protein